MAFWNIVYTILNPFEITPTEEKRKRNNRKKRRSKKWNFPSRAQTAWKSDCSSLPWLMGEMPPSRGDGSRTHEMRAVIPHLGASKPEVCNLLSAVDSYKAGDRLALPGIPALAFVIAPSPPTWWLKKEVDRLGARALRPGAGLTFVCRSNALIHPTTVEAAGNMGCPERTDTPRRPRWLQRASER